MKLNILFIICIFVSLNTFSSEFKLKEKSSEMTYAQTLEYCLEDGDEWSIPNKELLVKVIVVGDLQDLDKWFWSSTRAPEELCDGNICYYQVHTTNLEERIRLATELGHGICTFY
ncbi:MAG: hypothetical protein A2381_02255 [Bdellovibrionales bacterium RIFOXYB1_FULL_37_110]|nr:MAG: hypothetical protein A2417_13560 [Bdellovibrionales bacterium RIFOXYC1_FULL_37_79]OFZ59261.1 MAG: hypothetical protein A2381_02255 [Bdellovibrionales bacterium RIFOXYB1_FULL_37_110]OFZ62887.1 MAG: hypothetical protein A2577_11210 [Bdellovibrionales bacterium RIFOXYD1_FULL_36_51]OFZ66901.1 MAG: hypothetical protein A2328_06150 [Bdellovibrionales bacterium RIFOXYB2_FULL_36_6]